MPPTQDPSSGSLTGAPLWTLTAVVILVAGLLFYFVSQPLAEAFDALMPAPQEAVPVVEQAPPPPPPEEPPPPPPRIWTADEIEAGMAELATTLGPLIEAGTAELPTYSELGATPTAAEAGEGEEAVDPASVQRAAARWARWGVIWRNRVDAERSKLPPQSQCVGHQGLQAGCVELHDLLEDLETVADAGTYVEATERMDAAAARLDLYLNPPLPTEDEATEDEETEGEETEDEATEAEDGASLDVSEPPQ